jgi:hypothetical protein
VEQRFGRRVPAAAVNATGLVDVEDLGWLEAAFVHGTGRDRQPQRLAAGDHAEVAAGAEHPAASVEATAGVDERVGGPRMG